MGWIRNEQIYGHYLHTVFIGRYLIMPTGPPPPPPQHVYMYPFACVSCILTLVNSRTHAHTSLHSTHPMEPFQQAILAPWKCSEYRTTHRHAMLLLSLFSYNADRHIYRSTY